MDDSSNQIVTLENQLAEVRSMAFQLMRTNGDTGRLLQFLKSSFKVNSFEELAHLLLEHLANSDLKASLLVLGPQGEMFFTLDLEDEMIDHIFIQKHLYAGRLYESNNRLIINYPLCSLLINNLPDDDTRRGELRDTLAILMDGVEAKINTIILANKADEARNIKDAFFSLMSHELKTPLNPIIGYSNRLAKKLEDKLDDKEKLAFEHIKKNCDHLSVLIDDILALATVKNNEVHIHPKNICIVDLIEDVIGYLKCLSDEHKVSISTCEKGEQICHVDPYLMKDVFIALLSNAIKYSPNGNVGIKVDELHDTTGQFVTISFKDDGKGIAEENLEKIFHHFSERDDPSTQKIRSRGISLFLAREIVRRHMGQISVKSAVSQGSEFTILLPLIGLSNNPNNDSAFPLH